MIGNIPQSREVTFQYLVPHFNAAKMKSSNSSIPNYSYNHLERAFFLWNIFPASQSCITENYSASHPSLKKKIPVLSACLNGAKRKLKIEASGQRELILFSKLKCSIRG